MAKRKSYADVKDEIKANVNPKDYKSLIKAIRLKCLDCCGNQTTEVSQCTVTACALYQFHIGKNLFTKKKELTEEQK